MFEVINLTKMDIKMFFSFFLFLLSVLTVLPFFDFNFFLTFFSKNVFEPKSSIWCTKNFNYTNICKLKNICYDSELKTLLFFLHENSVIKGLTDFSDFQKLQLSSLNTHNQFYANFSMIDSENYEIKKQIKVQSKVLLFSRFKPNNIMHVFHDDLFPIFLTLEWACSGDSNCIKNYKLLFHDHHLRGPFFELYKAFSRQTPELLNEMPWNSDYILCFEEMLIGLVQDSIFYQYGFNKPHGPVKSIVTQNDVVRFTSFIKEGLNINNKNNSSDIVLINRTKTRRILNAEELKQMVRIVFEKVTNKNKLKMSVLDLHSNNAVNFIKVVSNADILIGMHGAEMIFSLFMKPTSVVVELFPFGIQSEFVSFVRSLSKIEGSYIHYIYWENVYKNNSVSHPNAHPLFGGINHLDKSTQEKLKNIQKVPPVECCNNPVYLYHMYQDTLIANEFKNFLHESLNKYYSSKSTEVKQIIQKWFYPSLPSNVSCKFQSDQRLINISWQHSFNVKNYVKLKYSAFIRETKNFFEREIVTDLTNLEVKVPEEIKSNSEFQIWISVYYDINHSKSQDLYLQCS